MNDDDVSFDRVKRYNLADTIANITVTISDRNMKGFLFVPGLDVNSDPPTLSAIAVDPSGFTFGINYEFATQANGDPNGSLSGNTSTSALLGNLIDNTMPFLTVGGSAPQFFSNVIIEATVSYGDTVSTPSALYTFF